MAPIAALFAALLAFQAAAKTCDGGNCAAKAYKGAALLQSHSGLQADATKATEETVGTEGAAATGAMTLKEQLKSAPLVGKVMTLESEAGKMKTAVAELETAVGVGSAPAAAPAEEAAAAEEPAAEESAAMMDLGSSSLLQEGSDDKKKFPAKRPRVAPVARAAVDDAAGFLEQEPAEGEAAADAPSPAAKGGPLKGRVTTLEQTTSQLLSRVGTLENEVMGKTGVSLLQNNESRPQPVRRISLEEETQNSATSAATSLKARVAGLEDKMDSIKMRVNVLKHETLG